MELTALDPASTDTSLRGGVSSAVGSRRVANEDAFVCGPVWFAVADGMGGHRAGDVASRLAIDTVRQSPAPRSIDDMVAVADAANDRIRQVAREAGFVGMGTTLVALADHGEGVVVMHIGDSRCYRLVDGRLTLVTRDHSHVQDLVDLGRITADEVDDHRLRHVVTRALGVDPVSLPDLEEVAAPVGRLLLCSDGLAAELSPRTIGRVLSAVVDPQRAAERLVQLAQRRAARDDVTAVVVDHESRPS
jgi:protein phosphatase